MTASKYSFKLTRLRPASAYPNLLDHTLQVHPHTRLITAIKCISTLVLLRPSSAAPKSLNHSLQLHLQTRVIAASSCISNLSRSRPPQCIPTLARSRPRRLSLSSLNCHFQTHLELLSSTGCSRSRYTVCRWVAIFIHRYINRNTN
jgi:hypothetical protein